MTGRVWDMGGQSFLAWNMTAPDADVTDNYILSPSFQLASPFIQAQLKLDFGSDPALTSVEFGLQTAANWVDDDTANWFPAIQINQAHSFGTTVPYFLDGTPVSIVKNSAYSYAGGDKNQCSPVSFDADNGTWVPVVGKVCRLVAGVAGSLLASAATNTNWKIWITERKA